MTRLTLAATPGLALAMALTALTPAAAQDTATECALQRDVVMQVVSARADGADMTNTTRQVAADLGGDAAKYAVIVPDIAAWIYTLPEDQLTAAVGQSWVDACLAQ